MNLIKLQRPFYKIKETDIVINKEITQELLNREEFDNTILDSRLELAPGYIRIKPGITLYNYFNAKQKIKNLQLYNVSHSYVSKKVETYRIDKDEYIKIPQGVNKVFKLDNGIKILTRLQRAYNNLIVENNTIRNTDENIIYQNLYTNLLVEFNNLLAGKGGLYDRAVCSLWPFSCRATVVPGPNLKINEVSLPYKVLMSWVSKEEVRKAFNIDLNIPNREAVKLLEGKRVLLGRQPSHWRDNLMSFIIRIKYNNS